MRARTTTATSEEKVPQLIQEESQHLLSAHTDEEDSNESEIECASADNEIPRRIPLNLSQDIYSAFVLLKERGLFDELSRGEQLSFYFWLGFAAFTQCSGAVVLFLEDHHRALYSDLETVKINGEPSTIEFTVTIPEDPTLTDVLIRCSAMFVLCSYVTQWVGSNIDFSVLAKSMRRLPLLMLMVLFQQLVTYMICRVSMRMLLRYNDTVDVLSLCVGFVFLMEVDEYIFDAFKTNLSSRVLADDVFNVELTVAECKGTIYEKHRPLVVKTVYNVLFFTAAVVNLVQWAMYNMQHSSHSNVTEAVKVTGPAIYFGCLMYPYALTLTKRWRLTQSVHQTPSDAAPDTCSSLKTLVQMV